jgi:hypothetical protein
MYKLTLTGAEIRTILFIASRGYCEAVAAVIHEVDDLGEHTFEVPEHMAWAIKEEEETNGGHRFGPVSEDLTHKLYAFCDQLV